MSADESITSLSEAVAVYGALPMPVPVGPEPQGSDVAAEQLDFLHRVTLPDLRREVQHHQDGKARWRKRAETAEARVAELEAQRERRRVRLVALQNDALSMRGSLSPMGEDRKVPFPLGETLTPAVDWLIGRVAELEAERHSTNEALDDAVQALRAVPKMVFRASHDSIVMGLYSTREAAQAHCEAKVQEEEPEGSILHLSWSADDIGPDAEYELHITPTRTGNLIRGTGYVVTPVEVASAYDPDADE